MKKIRYGIASRTATYWNLYVARAEGLYAAQALEVEPVVTGGTRQTVHSLLADQTVLGGCSPDELVSAVQRGADLVVIGGIINRPVSSIVGRPELRDLTQLRGRRIGVNQTRGSVSMVLRAALQRAGLGAGDYEQVSVGSTPAMAVALREGRIDAAMLTAPFDLDLVRQGFAALLNVGTLFPRYAFTTINARRAWVEAHPAEIEAFFQATRAAGALIADEEQRNRVRMALAQDTGLSGEALKDTDRVYREPGVLARRGEVEPGALQALIELMGEQGLLAGPAPGIERLLLPRRVP